MRVSDLWRPSGIAPQRVHVNKGGGARAYDKLLLDRAVFSCEMKPEVWDLGFNRAASDFSKCRLYTREVPRDMVGVCAPRTLVSFVPVTTSVAPTLPVHTRALSLLSYPRSCGT